MHAHTYTQKLPVPRMLKYRVFQKGRDKVFFTGRFYVFCWRISVQRLRVKAEYRTNRFLFMIATRIIPSGKKKVRITT